MLTKAHAKVTLTIELPIESSWGGDCRLDQVRHQAKDAALNQVRKWTNDLGVKLIGDPKVAAIVVEEA